MYAKQVSEEINFIFKNYISIIIFHWQYTCNKGIYHSCICFLHASGDVIHNFHLLV